MHLLKMLVRGKMLETLQANLFLEKSVGVIFRHNHLYDL